MKLVGVAKSFRKMLVSKVLVLVLNLKHVSIHSYGDCRKYTWQLRTLVTNIFFYDSDVDFLICLSLLFIVQSSKCFWYFLGKRKKQALSEWKLYAAKDNALVGVRVVFAGQPHSIKIAP